MSPINKERSEVVRYRRPEYRLPTTIVAESQQVSAAVTAPYLELLKNYWILLVAAALVCGGAAYVVSLQTTPSYQAVAQIEIRDPSDEALSGDHSSQTSLSGDSYFQTQIEMLSSRALLARVVERLGLDRQFEQPKTGAGRSWLKRLTGTKERLVSPRNQAVAMLRDGLTILPPRGASRLVSIQFESADAELAAKVPNTIGEEFIKQDQELRQKSSSRTTEWLSGELSGLRNRLESSEASLQQYSTSVGLMMLNTDHETVAQAKLRQLQDDLSKAQEDRIGKQAAYELTRKGGSSIAAQLLDNGPLREYAVKLADAQQRLAQLDSILTPNHYKVKETQAEIAALQLTMDTEGANMMGRTVSEYDSATRREELLRNAFEAQTHVVSTQDAETARYVLLNREVATNRQIYETVLQKVKSVQIDAALRPDNIVVVDPAEPPSGPYKPRPNLNAGVGALAGLFLSGGCVLVSTRRERKFRTPEEAVQYLNVPELGAIPSLMSERGLLPSIFFPIRRGTAEAPADLASLREAPSAVTDSFRAAVASILFTCGSRKGTRVLTVTSAAPREGKTTVVANLAVVLAQMKFRVLAIDGDVRKPRLHTLFGMDNRQGMVDLLAETGVWDRNVWSRYARETSIPGLSVMTSGPSPAPHAEVLDAVRIKFLIDFFRAEFDIIMIDTPPVLSLVDSRIFSRQSDGVIVVCRASATDPTEARGATRRLQSDGSVVLGTILTDMPAGNSSYYKTAYHQKDGQAKSFAASGSSLG